MKKLIVVDISNFIFRAFFAIRPLNSVDGTPVNAVYGVLSMLLKIIKEYEPTHILIARDTKKASFRKEKYEAYKANRTEPPEELIPQFALIEKLIDLLDLKSLALPGFEADDIIGSAVTKYREDFDEILIASGDKDLMQFVDGPIKMLDSMKDKVYGPAEVEEKMGVRPDQIVDYLSLIGDSSDNIPGVPGIGPKGASKLLKEFETLEGCIENLDKITNKRAHNALKENLDKAYLSKELIEIVTDLKEVNFPSDELKYQLTPGPLLKEYLEFLNFKSFIKKLGFEEKSSLKMTETSQSLGQKRVQSVAELERFLAKSKNHLACYAVWQDKLDPFAKLNGIALANEKDSIYLEVSSKLNEEEVWKSLSEVKSALLGVDLKLIYIRLLKHSTILPPPIDLMQAYFVINPDRKMNFEQVLEETLGEEVIGLNSQADLLDSPGLERPSLQRVGLMKELWSLLKDDLKEKELEKAFFEIDMPLIKVLAEMEKNGVDLNSKFYFELEKEFTLEVEKIHQEIQKIAGMEVNLRSPKQVGSLLFEKLELPVIKKTKTGFSTDADTLQELAETDLSPIPSLILKYRELDKLNSTYVKVFPKLVNEKTKKLHTHFKLNNAATGRLSSDNPNLQNIPVRTENGRRLRKGFIAPSGHKLLSADYSQVELRILAHLSQDPVMIDAFLNDKDIHQQTAAEIFGLKLNEVTKDQRSSAKAINFGLMYGQTSFGLSQTLRISQKEAKDYITTYFERFHDVKIYLDSLKDICEKTGFAETIFGRKRYLPDIKSTNRQVKAMAERVAINSPIQGTAADIIKIAMVNIFSEMDARKLKSKMILQVHDELIFEVPAEELDEMTELVPQLMEGVVQFKVPLKVDYGVGDNWFDLK